MIFNRHSNLEGAHAFLSPSKYSWLNYDEEKLYDSDQKYLSVVRGTELHERARRLIRLGVRLPRKKETLNMYVNDAIGFKMTPEQPLVYSSNSFGTADAICFRKNFLRIHDLKSGVTPASMRQLDIYTALFCLEYNVNPYKIGLENRIYQNNSVAVRSPNPEDIHDIMEKIISFDERIEQYKNGGF